MKRLAKTLAIISGIFAVAVAAFLIWAYSSELTFEPASYRPVAADYWTTDWRHSTPETSFGTVCTEVPPGSKVWQERATSLQWSQA